MKRSAVLAALLGGAALWACLAVPPAAAQGPLTAPGGSSEIWGDARAELVDRIFRAVLDRSPDSIESERAAEEVAAGRLGALIDSLASSSEYRLRRSNTTAAVERFFQSLLDRGPSNQEAYSFSSDLARGRDAEVLRRIVDSAEFRRVLEGGPTLDGGPVSADTGDVPGEAERACEAGLNQSLTRDLGRAVRVRVVSANVTESTVLTDRIEGDAELDDGSRRRLTYTCRVARFGGAVEEVAYEMTPGGAAESAGAFVRCGSPDGRYHRCPVDTRGGVRLERRESVASCVQGTSWGYDGDGIWVDRGCQGVFQVGAPPAEAAPALGLGLANGLEATVDGWGFVRQRDGRAEWLRQARVDLDPDGGASIELAGDGSARFVGRWFEAGGGRVEIQLTNGDGGRTIGAGTLELEQDGIHRIELAGVAGTTPFNLVFSRHAAIDQLELEAAGRGLVAIADGRRVELDRALIDLARDGRATLRFSGAQQETFYGLWFAGVEGTIELAIDRASDEGVRGAGTLHRGSDGHFEVEIAGVSDRGQGFRIEFLGER